MSRGKWHTPTRKERFGLMKLDEKPEGIVYHSWETNPALAERDYKVRCDTEGEPIVIFEGYHFWWCVPHQQPLYQCDYDKLEIEFTEAKKKWMGEV